jgi:phosphoserine phosphatase RsbU/P
MTVTDSDSHDDNSKPLLRRTGRCFWLVGLEGRADHVRLPITSTVLIGRATNNHVVLEDSRLSRQHSRFAPEADGCVVYDLNSVNGTFVNDVRVTTRRVLQVDDVVRVGPFAFRIEQGDAPSERMVPKLDAQTMRGLEAARPPESVVSRMLSFVEGRDSAARLPPLDLDQVEDAQAKLGTLYAFMQAMGKTSDRRALLDVMATQIRGVYPGSSSVRVYLHSERGASELLMVQEASDTPSSGPRELPADVRASVLESGMAILTRAADGGTDMYAPIIDRGEVLGVIHVSSGTRTFSRADLDLLNGMASPAALMLQNTRMHEQSLDRDRMQHDLTLAAQIQKSFLPREVISVEGIELVAEYRAAYTIGGDFYDVFWVAPNRLGVFIGDISGKGVSAALLMARISGELRVAALAHVDPVKVLSTMNKATLDRRQPELFFTAIYFTLDVTTGEILLANAGHCPPYHVRSSGALEAVTAGGGAPVGILEDTAFEATRLRLEPNESLVLYTDGVVEAASANGTLYGNDRLEAALAYAGVRPNVIAEQVLKSVAAHAASGPPSDDLTLLICHRSVDTGQPKRRSSSFPQMFTPTDPFVPKAPPSSRKR